VAAPHQPTIHPPAAAWPHAAQLAAAFLLGAAAALLAIRLIHGPANRPLDFVAGPPIDLNRAGRGELLQLPGVGPVLADRIVDVRDSRGGFRTADDLRSVSGIGPARLEKLRPWVRSDGDLPAVEHGPAAAPKAAKKSDARAEPVNVNTAPADELQTLPGVGPKLAQRIVDERAKRPFATVEDLRRVSGIGPKTLEKLRPFVTVGPRRIR
jgi:competence protein ComEA